MLKHCTVLQRSAFTSSHPVLEGKLVKMLFNLHPRWNWCRGSPGPSRLSCRSGGKEGDGRASSRCYSRRTVLSFELRPAFHEQGGVVRAQLRARSQRGQGWGGSW